MGFKLDAGGTSGFSLGTGGSSSGFDYQHMTADPGESIYNLGNPDEWNGYSGGGYYTTGDAYEAAKMTQFYPSSTTTGAPWWESLARYGVTRAVDAAIGPPPLQYNQPGTFAGQNGQTYSQGRAAVPVNDGSTMLLFLGIGALVLFTMAD